MRVSFCVSWRTEGGGGGGGKNLLERRSLEARGCVVCSLSIGAGTWEGLLLVVVVVVLMVVVRFLRGLEGTLGFGEDLMDLGRRRLDSGG